MNEQRAARLLNLTMVSALGILALGFFVWATVNQFGEIRQIYLSLSAEQQRQVTRFALTLITLLNFLIVGWRFAKALIEPKPTQTVA